MEIKDSCLFHYELLSMESVFGKKGDIKVTTLAKIILYHDTSEIRQIVGGIISPFQNSGRIYKCSLKDGNGDIVNKERKKLKTTHPSEDSYIYSMSLKNTQKAGSGLLLESESRVHKAFPLYKNEFSGEYTFLPRHKYCFWDVSPQQSCERLDGVITLPAGYNIPRKSDNSPIIRLRVFDLMYNILPTSVSDKIVQRSDHLKLKEENDPHQIEFCIAKPLSHLRYVISWPLPS